MNHIMRINVGVGTGNNGTSLDVIAKLLENLLWSLNSIGSKVCKQKIMQCIGEAGAIDAAAISRIIEASNSESQRHSSRSGRSYPRQLYPLITLLLDRFLAFALGRSEERARSSNYINRVWIVVQELLNACSCNEEAVVLARKTFQNRTASKAEVDWDNVTILSNPFENSVHFWEHLSCDTQNIVFPVFIAAFRCSAVHRYIWWECGWRW